MEALGRPFSGVGLWVSWLLQDQNLETIATMSDVWSCLVYSEKVTGGTVM